MSPMLLMNGLMAMRTGYFSTSLHGRTPFARAVTTYGLFSSSSRLARRMRMVKAAAPRPTMTIGSHMCDSRSTTRAQLQAASSNSGEKRPPVLTPNHSKPMCMKMRASRNGGVASPTSATVVMT